MFHEVLPIDIQWLKMFLIFEPFTFWETDLKFPS